MTQAYYGWTPTFSELGPLNLRQGENTVHCIIVLFFFFPFYFFQRGFDSVIQLVLHVMIRLGRNTPYMGSLEAGLQLSNKELVHGLVCPPRHDTLCANHSDVYLQMVTHTN